MTGMAMKRQSWVWVGVLMMLTIPATGQLPAMLGDGEPMPSLAPMMERVTPAVVNIATFTNVEVRNPLFDDPFFRRFFDLPSQEQRYRRTRSAGSGVIVDAAKGYILTNDHVVSRADEITVTLADGRTLEATLVGADAQVDLAVLKIDADELAAEAAARFADSASLRVGDFVVAIGNPFGLGQTVTSGIVSAIGRSGLGVEGYEDFIQTDASINPGNSGGALVNLRGELVGINTAIIAPAGGNVGIGFAIPANMARAIMAELIAHGEVRRGHLGLQIQGLNVELAQAFGIDQRDGVVVTGVDVDSPAAAAGLELGDVLVRLGERPLRNATDFRARAAVIMVGDSVEIEYVRDGRRKVVRVDVPEDQFEKVAGQRLHPLLSGALLQNHRGGTEREVAAGVALLEVTEGSRAWRNGLRAGDIVVSANQRTSRNLSDLTQGIKLSPRSPVLRIWREGQFYQVRLR
ncbi:MAG: Do family serine endopeptidase [Gammaproteobacteria bacterium]|nr:Do family serine endopeptidase [Gammaproteobacteria bacterium]